MEKAEMKPALMVTIIFMTNERRNTELPVIRSRVFGKPLWAGQTNLVATGLDGETNRPTIVIEARFENEPDRADVLGYLKGIEHRPDIEVRGSTHDCYHSLGGKSCDNWKPI